MADDQLFQRFGKELTAGTVLFREGETGRDMYVVQAGRVTVTIRVGDVEKILSTLGPGEFVGEMAILNNKPRSATATCATDCKLLHVDAKTFEAMVRSSGEIALRMIKKLAERLQDANDQIENLLLSDSSARVVHYLASAAEKAAKGGTSAKVPLAPAELAGRCGVKPEAADVALQKLVKAKILSVEAGGLDVPDVSKLRHFLEFLQMKAQFGDLG